MKIKTMKDKDMIETVNAATAELVARLSAIPLDSESATVQIIEGDRVGTITIKNYDADPIQPATIKKDGAKFFDSFYSRQRRPRSQQFSQHFKK